MNLDLPHSKAVRETEKGVEYIYIKNTCFLPDIHVCACTCVCVFNSVPTGGKKHVFNYSVTEEVRHTLMTPLGEKYKNKKYMLCCRQ